MEVVSLLRESTKLETSASPGHNHRESMVGLGDLQQTPMSVSDTNLNEYHFQFHSFSVSEPEKMLRMTRN